MLECVHLSNRASVLVGKKMKFLVMEKVSVLGFLVLFEGFGKKMACVHETIHISVRIGCKCVFLFLMVHDF